MRWLLFLLPLNFLFADPLTPDAALKRLLEGNKRYVEDALSHPNQSATRREAIVSKQSPFAVVVGCSDSRVSPEILFDQGIGDLFVVRVAGNVIGPLELDSIEYSSLYLGSSLILVMGHENCGAVSAVLSGKTKEIESIATLIEPSVEKAKKIKPTDPLKEAIELNVVAMVHALKNTKVLSALLKEGKIKIVGGYYNLQTGEVEILSF